MTRVYAYEINFVRVRPYHPPVRPARSRASWTRVAAVAGAREKECDRARGNVRATLVHRESFVPPPDPFRLRVHGLWCGLMRVCGGRVCARRRNGHQADKCIAAAREPSRAVARRRALHGSSSSSKNWTAQSSVVARFFVSRAAVTASPDRTGRGTDIDRGGGSCAFAS